MYAQAHLVRYHGTSFLPPMAHYVMLSPHHTRLRKCLLRKRDLAARVCRYGGCFGYIRN